MLSLARVEKLTGWTVAMHDARDFESLAEVATSAVSDLVSCDTPLLSLAPQMPVGGRLFHAKVDRDWDAMVQTALRHSPQDPVYTGRLRLTLNGAASTGQFVSREAFERTSLYNEAWRPMGARWMLADFNPGIYGYRLCAVRHAGDDFDRADATILHAIARHLDAATGTLVRTNSGLLPTRDGKVPIVTCGWIVCDRSGRVLRIKEGAGHFLRACLGERAPLDRVPPSWTEEFRAREAGRPGTPKHFRSGERSIAAYIAPIRGTPEEFSVFFVEQRTPPDPTARVMALGLTRREAEVLRWVAEGKTNPEIGIILGISELTAKKHMENVLHKLGVPTRTAAAARAMERLQAGA